jgi:hypothetical protein
VSLDEAASVELKRKLRILDSRITAGATKPTRNQHQNHIATAAESQNATVTNSEIPGILGGNEQMTRQNRAQLAPIAGTHRLKRRYERVVR